MPTLQILRILQGNFGFLKCKFSWEFGKTHEKIEMVIGCAGGMSLGIYYYWVQSE